LQYADLDFPSTRCHIFPLVKHRLFPHVPTLRTLRWFAHDEYLRLLDYDGANADAPAHAAERADWVWSDDPRARPVTIPWMRDALPPAQPLDLGSAGAAQESYGARLAGEAFSSPGGSSSPFGGARVLGGGLEDNDAVDVEAGEGAARSGAREGRRPRTRPRLSVLELLEAAADETAVPASSRRAEGKGKAKAVLRERQSSATEQQDDVFWTARRA